MYARVGGVYNLRESLPKYATRELAQEWAAHAFPVIASCSSVDVPCAIPIGVRRMLFQIIRSMNARTVLDIGTYVGTSALAFALAVGDAGHVVTVDSNDVNSKRSYWSSVNRMLSPEAMLHQAGVGHRVSFVTEDSLAYMRSTERKFDFISIDGWHDEDHVYEEIVAAISLLNYGGLVFMDDIQTRHPPPGLDRIKGPWRALRRHLSEGLPVEVVFINRTLEGDMAAGAVLTRKYGND